MFLSGPVLCCHSTLCKAATEDKSNDRLAYKLQCDDQMEHGSIFRIAGNFSVVQNIVDWQICMKIKTNIFLMPLLKIQQWPLAGLLRSSQ